MMNLFVMKALKITTPVCKTFSLAQLRVNKASLTLTLSTISLETFFLTTREMKVFVSSSKLLSLHRLCYVTLDKH